MEVAPNGIATGHSRTGEFPRSGSSLGTFRVTPSSGERGTVAGWPGENALWKKSGGASLKVPGSMIK